MSERSRCFLFFIYKTAPLPKQRGSSAGNAETVLLEGHRRPQKQAAVIGVVRSPNAGMREAIGAIKPPDASRPLNP